MNAVWRNGQLATCFTTAGPAAGVNSGEATAHWVLLDDNGGIAPTLSDQGDIGGEDIAAGTFTFFPSVALNMNGDLAIGFAASAPSIFPGSYVTAREAADPAGTVQNSVTLRAGTDWYFRQFSGTRNRWGDYTGIAVDPSNDLCFWVYNEHAITRGLPSNGGTQDGRWGTAWGNLCLTAMAPANDLCANAEPLSCGDDITVDISLASGTDNPGTCATFGSSEPGVWYTIVGTGGNIHITTCNPGTNYDTKITVWEGTCGALTCVTGNDDQSGGFDPACNVTGIGANSGSTVDVCTTLGTTYYVYLYGFVGTVGTAQMTVTCDPVVPLSIVCPPDAGTTVIPTDPLPGDATVMSDVCRTVNTVVTGPVVVGEGCIGTTWTYTFTVTDDLGNMETCDQVFTATEDILPVINHLALDDQINISMGIDCEVEITSDLFLEGDYGFGCLSALDVSISGLPSNIVTECGTYTVTVTDPTTGNSGWGTVVVEDKLPPQSINPCPADDPCDIDCVSFASGTWPAIDQSTYLRQSYRLFRYCWCNRS